MKQLPPSTWTRKHTLALVIGTIGIVGAGILLATQTTLFTQTGWRSGRLWTWYATMFLITGSIAIIGHGVTGRWLGALIDNRNRMSLSRLQIIVWFVLVFSALLAAGVANIVLAQGEPGVNPLAITLPPEVLAAMGISLTAALGAPLILSTKTGAHPNPIQKQHTFDAFEQRGTDPVTLGNRGLIVTRHAISDAQVADLFLGEEVGNAAQIDVGKVQMAYMTLILVTIYAIAIGSLFTTHLGAIAAFPNFDGSLLALLGISQGGYLAAKLVPHSASALAPITPGGADNAQAAFPKPSKPREPVKQAVLNNPTAK